MTNTNPPSDGGNQGWTPPQPQPQQPQPQYQPQQPPPGYQPPQGYQPQPQYQPPPIQQPPPAPKPPSQFTMQNANKFVRDVPQLVKLLRMIAWIELLAIPILAVISFCTIFGVGFYFSGAFSSFSSLASTVIQSVAIWGLLMAAALLLENQAAGRSDK